jgi:uncharacterized membrane protein
VACGDLVSVRALLRLLLYGGVLLAAGGIGLFLKENHDRLGPALVASLAGAAAIGCLAYVVRRAPRFSWDEVESPHVAVDYLLLLGMLLVAADLAYIEAQFGWLGPHWAYHLLAVAVVYFLAAYRFDSRAVLTLALTSFAAWRGVEVGMPFAGRRLEAAAASPGFVRANAIACGLLYLTAGVMSLRLRRKPHFEQVYVTGGLLLVFGAMVTGAWDELHGGWVAWLAVLALSAIVLAVVSYRLRRPLDFGIAVAAFYLAGMRTLGEIFGSRSNAFTLAAWSVLALVVLIRATRRMRSEA